MWGSLDPVSYDSTVTSMFKPLSHFTHLEMVRSKNSPNVGVKPKAEYIHLYSFIYTIYSTYPENIFTVMGLHN